MVAAALAGHSLALALEYVLEQAPAPAPALAKTPSPRATPTHSPQPRDTAKRVVNCVRCDSFLFALPCHKYTCSQIGRTGNRKGLFESAISKDQSSAIGNLLILITKILEIGNG